MDLNREICSIAYNCLNLPQRVDFQDGSYVLYTYNAGGEKMRTDYYINPLPNMVPQLNGGTGMNRNANLQHTRVDYCGNLVYENDTLKQVLIDGGYVTFNGSSPQYHFYVQDHLGNNRVVCNASGTIEQVNHYYPYGGLFGESTNDEVQRYKYNGKELDRMHGLNLYDYSARQYDATVGKFTTMDPLCEKYYNVSPYAYCVGNPVNYVDPMGMEPDSLDAAMMSSLAYEANPEYTKMLNKNGWYENKSLAFESVSGFKSKVFQKQKSDNKFEYCISFAGTDTKEGALEFAKDGVTDVLNFWGYLTPQYMQSAVQAFEMSSVVKNKSDLTYTGHSLGGGLATIASKLTGSNAIIFNPASISGVIGGVGGLVGVFKGGNIIQYRSCGDYVNLVQDIMFKPSSGEIKYVNTGRKWSHGINDIINTFNKKRK